jgi:hypothetical protein
MTLSYLLDENVPRALQTALSRKAPELPVWRVGGRGAPPRGTPDPEILRWCEERKVVLVTNNRGSMPVHLQHHLAQGRHVPGIFIMDTGVSLAETADELVLIAGATEPYEHQDLIRFLPLST